MIRRLPTAAAALALLLAALTGCTSQPAPAASGAPTPSVGEPRITTGLSYVPGGTSEQTLDACIPRGGSAPRPAVVVVHGGSFLSGDKATQGLRYICTRLARAGYDAFSIDYRLLPGSPYPAALHDLQAAIRWIRADAQVSRFGLDPKRIGAFGESAGAVLVAENGTAGSGSLDSGTRTRAVVSLSTAPNFQLDPSQVSGDALKLALGYLGCRSLKDCPAAKKASALAAVDPSDPPFLLAASKGDWIPPQGSVQFAGALKKAGIPVELDIEDGSGHGLQLVTPDLAKKVLAFYAEHL